MQQSNDAKLPLPVRNKAAELSKLCLKFHVSELFIFGFALTSGFHDNSDLDFMVTFADVPELDYADNFFDFRDALQSLFNRKIDLVESQTLKNPYFRSVVQRTKLSVYTGGSSVKMVV